MTVIAMFSDKGSPGVTTLGIALARVWPRRITLVELDPAGGDLALRMTDDAGRPLLGSHQSLLTLAAAARRGPAQASLLREHTQPLPGAGENAAVITGLATPEQGAGMGELWPAVIDAARTAAEDVLLDLGRMSTLPGTAAAECADIVLGVARADAASMLRLRDRMRQVVGAMPSSTTRRAMVVLVAEDRRAAEAIAALHRVLLDSAVDSRVAGALAVDAASVAAVYRGHTGPRLDRSLLLRSARALVPALLEDEALREPAQRPRLLARSR